MKSFLVKGKKPIIKWGFLPDNKFFEGEVPEGFKLAISPSDNYIVVDVDRHGDVDGFGNIPNNLIKELDGTLNYCTKNNGKHYWFKHSGNSYLANKTSSLGIDLRTNKGYVVWYPKGDVRDHLDEISDTSPEMNDWLSNLFGFGANK